MDIQLLRKRMSSHLEDYMSGRSDGLLLALQIVRDGGQEALEKEIRFRNITGFHTSLANKELDKKTEMLKQITHETMQIACISILHDKFGFGEKRCQRFISAFDKLDAYLTQGWTYWADLVENIKKELGMEMVDKCMKMNGMGGRYSHPEPEDLYDLEDLIVKEDWQQILLSLRYKEKEVGKGVHEIYDENGDLILRYEGIWNKIQVFDVMTGILIAKDHYGIEDEKAK